MTGSIMAEQTEGLERSDFSYEGILDNVQMTIHREMERLQHEGESVCRISSRTGFRPFVGNRLEEEMYQVNGTAMKIDFRYGEVPISVWGDHEAIQRNWKIYERLLNGNIKHLQTRPLGGKDAAGQE